MANKKFWLGILAIVLVFGMMVVGCDEPEDESLEGTWVGDGVELKLNDGNFEMSPNGSPYMKGTYTTNGNNMTLTPTHLHGHGTTFADWGLESKWYTKSELKEAMKTAAIAQAEAAGLTDAELAAYGAELDALFDNGLSDAFATTTVTYSVNGNTLTFGDSTLTRK